MRLASFVVLVDDIGDGWEAEPPRKSRLSLRIQGRQDLVEGALRLFSGGERMSDALARHINLKAPPSTVTLDVPRTNRRHQLPTSFPSHIRTSVRLLTFPWVGGR